MASSQGGVCAICQRPPWGKSARGSYIKRLSVDHDHETGKPRGLLCSQCNFGVGNFRNNPEWLDRAIHYLAPAGESYWFSSDDLR